MKTAGRLKNVITALVATVLVIALGASVSVAQGQWLTKNQLRQATNFSKTQFLKPGLPNVVHISRIAGVDSTITDGHDDVSAVEDCKGCVTSTNLGTITTRLGTSVMIPGGTESNGKYAVGTSTAFCLHGETMLASYWSWDGDPAAEDAELFVSDNHPVKDAANNQGILISAGNDSGTDHTLTAMVTCLAP